MSITGGTGSPAANSTPAHTYTFKHACVWHSRACSCAHMCMTPACMLLLASVPRGRGGLQAVCTRRMHNPCLRSARCTHTSPL